MMESGLKRYAPYAAVLGLAALVAAGVIYFLRREMDTAVQATLAVGLLGLALALLFNPGAVQTWLLGRQARYGSNVLLMVAALLGILVLANYLVTKNPQRWDWSEDQTNTLTTETLEMIRALEQPVKAVGFYTTNMATSQDSARTLLERYRIESGDQITYEFHNPNANPALAQAYNVTQDGSLFLEMGDQRQQVDFASEEQITGAISRLLNPVSRVVYFLSGSGERDFQASDQAGYSQVANQLRNQNYDLRPLNLAVTNTVPSDATALVVAGTQVPLSPEVVQVIKGYMDAGGKLLVLSDPPIQYQQPISVTEPLADYLRTDWGIDLGADVVLASFTSLEGQPFVPFAAEYGSHAITNDLRTIGSLYELARSVSVSAETANPAVSVTPLVLAGEDAWGEVTLDDPNRPTQLDPEDVQPPINLAVVGENMATGARVVVFGDSDFASNTWANQGADGRLFVGSVNWATKDENLISITPRVPTSRTLALVDALTLRLIFFVTVLVMPLAVLVIGVVVWIQRRRHV